jgi:hypothetical protein
VLSWDELLLEDPGIHEIHGKYRIHVDGMEGPHFSQHFVNLTSSQEASCQIENGRFCEKSFFYNKV